MCAAKPADERSARDAVAALRPDVAVVDWSLGSHEAFDLIRNFGETHPEMPILILSMHDELRYVEQALRLGARGYVTKHEAAECILEGIRRLQREVSIFPIARWRCFQWS